MDLVKQGLSWEEIGQRLPGRNAKEVAQLFSKVWPKHVTTVTLGHFWDIYQIYSLLEFNLESRFQLPDGGSPE